MDTSKTRLQDYGIRGEQLAINKHNKLTADHHKKVTINIIKPLFSKKLNTHNEQVDYTDALSIKWYKA